MRNLWISLFALIISMGSVMANNNIVLNDSEEDKDKRLLEKFKSALRKKEGKRLEAYKPDESEKHYTIGYGHYGSDVKKGTTITEDQAEELLDKDVRSRLSEVRKSIKNYDSYPENAQEAILSSWYRGSIKPKHKTVKLLNEGKFEEASKEFLNHQEYKDRKSGKRKKLQGVIDRMENTSREIFNIDKGRSPQSTEDKVNIQDSSIQKEDTMEIKRPEEEEEGKVDKARRNANVALQESTPAGQQLSEAQKRMFEKENLNPENQIKAATESQEKKASGQQISAKDNFMEAITYFLPSIAGLVVGGAIGGGEGAAQGAKLGMQAGEGYRQAQLEREKFEFQKSRANQPDAMAQERLNIQKSNLELRKQEIQEQRARTTNLEDDRSLRRDERKLTRQIQAKESFGKRGDVKKLQDQGLMLNDMKNIITDAPEVAAGTIQFKIAKGIAGEVGNLTQAEREDAQISPSFYRKMLRGGTSFLTGKLPEEDVKELQKVINALDRKRKEKLGTIIDGFTSSRYKGDDAFRQDLRNEFGVEEEEKKNATLQKIQSMTPQQRQQRLMELKKKYNR